jgi:hypothetical protein
MVGGSFVRDDPVEVLELETLSAGFADPLAVAADIVAEPFEERAALLPSDELPAVEGGRREVAVEGVVDRARDDAADWLARGGRLVDARLIFSRNPSLPSAALK